ncbi:hypothetical protein Sste5346_001417 [Sporothrix stenoceras]|uniref:histone acetyltransferase n=1 Tax=Sporothrix stenoceras TaxID=5173 RepID=A0ABR3ZP10_9PEZI
MADDLEARLAAVLPAGHNFGVYHISTPPTKTDALFHPPPSQRPDRTYVESHFLGVTITGLSDLKDKDNGDEVLAFALEIFIFTTAYSSTFFVAKADSSGYLHLLNLPKGTPSPIRAVSSVFLTFLVEQRRRAGVPAIISLFARAQSQYLFPGSVDNLGKHVLDDRGLVKWWCRVMDPLLLEDDKSHGYLVVPGLDTYETRAFLPKRPDQQKQWTLGHPLETPTISHYVTADTPHPPPRCLIPQYPDDPKARYLDELDEEAVRSNGKEEKTDKGDKKNVGWNGQWKSVKSLDQFWEMMAFRQECSSGRLTGFLWVVFEADPVAASAAAAKAHEVAEVKKPLKRKKKLRGYIVSRRPRPKTQQRNALAARPVATAYYRWPVAGRGRLLVDESDYKRINELLLQLDFSTLEKSAVSTRRWVQEAGVGSGDWRMTVVGTQAPVAVNNGNGQIQTASNSNGVTDLSNLVKRKRAPSEAAKAADPAKDYSAAAGVNVLSAGLVRKKTKVVESAPEEAANGAPAVNVLSAGLVRRKPKA